MGICRKVGHVFSNSSPMGTGDPIAEVKKIWIYTSTPAYAFMAQYLIS
jgi:hypothetical protein